MHTQSYKNVFVRVTYANKLWYLGVTPFGTPKPTAEYHVGIMVAFSECVCVYQRVEEEMPLQQFLFDTS